jgi:hypothetical protein
MARTPVKSETFTDGSAPRSLSTYNALWVNTHPAATELNTKVGGALYDQNQYGSDPAYYFNDTFADDQYFEISFDTLSTGTIKMGGILRSSTQTGSGQRDFYAVFIQYSGAGTTYDVYIHKVANNAWGSSLNASATVSLSGSDTFSAEIVGSTITCYKNTTTAITNATYTDSSSPYTSGYPGVYTNAIPASLWFITAWEGGNVTAGSSFIPRRALLGVG